jgi:hypothetical protein
VIVWLILLLCVQNTAETVSGTYTLDKDALRKVTVEKLQTELGAELNEAQLAAVDAELEKMKVSLTLEASGNITFSVETGEGTGYEGKGRWQLENADLSLLITHKYGLRLERKQLLKGTYANFTIFTRLAEGMPMITLTKLPPPEAKP